MASIITIRLHLIVVVFRSLIILYTLKKTPPPHTHLPCMQLEKIVGARVTTPPYRVPPPLPSNPLLRQESVV